MSTLDPVGPNAISVARLWWVMLAGSGVILIVMMLLVLVGFTRWRGWIALPSKVWLLGGGVIVPGITLAALLVFGLVTGEALLPTGRQAGAMRIEAVARQWEWTFRYPDAGGGSTTGVLYLPVGRPVDIHVTSEDVIHAFWIPRLAGKIDAIPGHVTVIRLMTPSAGTFRAQCAEFCGIGHTGMTFIADARQEAEFEAHLQSLTEAAGSPSQR